LLLIKIRIGVLSHPNLIKNHDCTPTSWSAEVEKGFYDVEITVGDSEIMARYDM